MNTPLIEPEFQEWKEKDLRKEGFLLAEGNFLVQRLLKTPFRLLELVCLPEQEEYWKKEVEGRCPVYGVNKQKMEKLAGFKFHRGVWALAKRPQEIYLDEYLNQNSKARQLLALPDLTDSENLGSLARSAWALGWDSVLLGPQSCDPWSRQCLKVSMGAFFFCPPIQLPSAQRANEKFKSGNWVSYAAFLDSQAKEVTTLNLQNKEKKILWIGNEAQGLTPPWLDLADHKIMIPMASTADSLNAAVAGGILLYLLSKTSSR